MTASLSLTVKKFIGYMSAAYLKFFNNDTESISLPEFIDVLCYDKSFS